MNFVPELMTVDELERGFRDLMARIYDPPFVSSRRKDFFRRRRAAGRRDWRATSSVPLLAEP